jgi:hypothetical protein
MWANLIKFAATMPALGTLGKCRSNVGLDLSYRYSIDRTSIRNQSPTADLNRMLLPKTLLEKISSVKALTVTSKT